MANPQDKQQHRFDFTTVAANVEELIEGSNFFRKFSVHVFGTTAAQQVDILASMDKVKFPVLLSAVATTVAGDGVAFQFELAAPFRGGLKIKFTNALAGGKIYVAMADNPLARRSTSFS